MIVSRIGQPSVGADLESEDPPVKRRRVELAIRADRQRRVGAGRFPSGAITFVSCIAIFSNATGYSLVAADPPPS